MYSRWLQRHQLILHWNCLQCKFSVLFLEGTHNPTSNFIWPVCCLWMYSLSRMCTVSQPVTLNRPDKPEITVSAALWSTVFAALLGLPLVSRWRCLSFPALSVKFLTKYKWVSLTNWFLKLMTESSCSEWSGQANERSVFSSIWQYSNSSNSNFHSVSLVDILHVLVVNFNSGWFSVDMFIFEVSTYWC
jgi:hypothetical protein